MKPNWFYLKKTENPKWSYVFLAGIAVSSVFVFLNRQQMFTENGFLNPVFLCRLETMELNRPRFFSFVLTKRLCLLWMMAFFSVTYAGMAAVYLFTAWLGVCAGLVGATLILRYGVEGLLLLAAGMMPHYLVYVPGVLMLLNWCVGAYRKNYRPLRFLMIHGVVIIGAILESYVNPMIVKEILKIF